MKYLAKRINIIHLLNLFLQETGSLCLQETLAIQILVFEISLRGDRGAYLFALFLVLNCERFEVHVTSTDVFYITFWKVEPFVIYKSLKHVIKDFL